MGIWDIDALGEAMPAHLRNEWAAFFQWRHTQEKQAALAARVKARTKGA